jgi:hypothetical protein
VKHRAEGCNQSQIGELLSGRRETPFVVGYFWVPADSPSAILGGHPISPPRLTSEARRFLTSISPKPARHDAASLPANDNQPDSRADLSFIDLINSDDEVAEIARRAERLGHIVLVVIALCLIGAPALYLASLYP